MICSVTDVMRVLERCDAKGYKNLKDVIDRNIPIEGYQANIMYLKKGYGKSHMSYILVAQKCMEILDTVPKVAVGSQHSDINPAVYDIDIGISHLHIQLWLEAFRVFIPEYYPELCINKLDSKSYCLTIERI